MINTWNNQRESSTTFATLNENQLREGQPKKPTPKTPTETMGKPNPRQQLNDHRNRRQLAKPEEKEQDQDTQGTDSCNTSWNCNFRPLGSFKIINSANSEIVLSNGHGNLPGNESFVPWRTIGVDHGITYQLAIRINEKKTIFMETCLFFVFVLLIYLPINQIFSSLLWWATTLLV